MSGKMQIFCMHTAMRTRKRQTVCGRDTLHVCVVFVGCNPFGNMLFFLPPSFHRHNGAHTIRNPHIDTNTMAHKNSNKTCFPFIDTFVRVSFSIKTVIYHKYWAAYIWIKRWSLRTIRPNRARAHTHVRPQTAYTHRHIHFAESINHRNEWLNSTCILPSLASVPPTEPNWCGEKLVLVSPGIGTTSVLATYLKNYN